MSKVVVAARAILSRIELFSKAVVRVPLRKYQLRPLSPIINSVLKREGKEFLLIFPRQSGKNEAVAQLLVYLLNLLQRVGGNIVYGATGDGLGRGVQRLEERLDNRWNRGKWGKASRPMRRRLGRAAVVFLSTHPQASARGETAHWLLVVDELQDQDGDHMEAVFEPMRAAENGTALYFGTVRTTSDALWRKKTELELDTERDGMERVFMVQPEEVIEENPAYGRFLANKLHRLGRKHPIVASEYFLEPIDGSGGLFPARRRALMAGTHARARRPDPFWICLATIDIGGQDEATTDPIAQLNNPGRDYTVAHIFEVALPSPAPTPAGVDGTTLPVLPLYRARDVMVDHGSRHFQDAPGRPSLVKRLVAWLEMWGVKQIIVDGSGVGEGIADWLSAVFGRERVTAYKFTVTGKKAELGSSFLSLVETGRFNYWGHDPESGESPLGEGVESEGATALSDGWWFWQQVRACTYVLPPGGRFERDLRWGVPAGTRISTPAGKQLIHDDRLISAALIAVADDLFRSGALSLGQAASAIIRPRDPFEEMEF
jgi:hypothetical protein